MAGNVEDRGTPRREVAWRGGIVRAEAGKRPRLIGTIGDPDTLMALVKADDWNQVHIIARGNQLTHIINGQIMTVLFDEDPAYFRPSGLIGLQIEQYGLGRVNFRDVWVKQARVMRATRRHVFSDVGPGLQTRLRGRARRPDPTTQSRASSDVGPGL